MLYKFLYIFSKHNHKIHCILLGFYLNQQQIVQNCQVKRNHSYFYFFFYIEKLEECDLHLYFPLQL